MWLAEVACTDCLRREWPSAVNAAATDEQRVRAATQTGDLEVSTDSFCNNTLVY